MYFPTREEIKYYLAVILCGLLGNYLINFTKATAYLKPITTMPLKAQLWWQEFILEKIEYLNELTRNKCSYLKNDIEDYSNLGKIGGQVITSEDNFPLELVKTSMNLCKLSYLNCEVGDVLEEFKVVKVIELVSYCKFYYLYAFIGEKTTDTETTYLITFRGTSNPIQFAVDLMLAPYNFEVELGEHTFNTDFASGYFKCLYDKDNNTGKSGITLLLNELNKLLSKVEKADLLVTGHSLGAVHTSTFIQALCSQPNQTKYSLLQRLTNITGIAFGEPVNGRKHENRLINHYMLEQFPNLRYYSIINNMDFFPAINSPLFTGIHSNEFAYILQSNDRKIYKINSDTLSFGLFVNSVLFGIRHWWMFLWNWRAFNLFLQVQLLLIMMTVYNHMQLTYVTALNSVLIN